MVDRIDEVLPLQGLKPVGHADSARLCADAFSVKVLFRGSLEKTEWQETFERVTGVTCPAKPNSVCIGKEVSAYWLGPDEVIVRYSPSRTLVVADDVVENAKIEFGNLSAAVVDVSDYYCVMNLSGPDALEVLEKGTPLDILTSVPDQHSCAQTRFGTAAILLNRTALGELTDFQIQTRASFAQYVWGLLAGSE